MDAPHLDGQYAAFGALTSGIEVVDKIASLKTDYYDCPREVPVIEKIEIL
jgi:peptidyl-prolyl cis-trans isomerase B (cyclophilin B)